MLAQPRNIKPKPEQTITAPALKSVLGRRETVNEYVVNTDVTTNQGQSNIFCNIGRVLTSSLNPEEVFHRVMKVIGEYFAPRNWSLMLMEKDTGRLKFEIVMGVDANKLKNVYLDRGEGVVGWVCQSGEPIVVGDVQNDSRFSSRVDELLGFTTRSVVCVPLLNGKNQVVGAIELINKIAPKSKYSDSGSPIAGITSAAESFTEMDMAILSSIGAFTGIAAENAFLHQKVKELAMIDSLTGINNRHYFNEIFNREVERVIRYSQTICILMMDVDGLKAINDNHGHLVGDRVLCAVADILKSSVRESDIVARFGGDEFVILMPLADESKGLELSRRIQELIDQWNEKSLIPGVKLGLSVGVHAAGPENVDNILLNADQELYQCKSFRKKSEELTSEDQMRNYLWDNIIARK